MANVIKRFVNEAILRNKLERWGAMYRLDDGKYYRDFVDTYSLTEAKRYFKKNCGDMDLFEFEPSYSTKAIIKENDYLYVYYIGEV